jgi:hypothetical protein
MRGLRHSLDKLRDVNGDLANEFDRVSRELEHHAISSEADSTVPGFYDQQTRTHRLLSEKWDTAVGRISEIDGFTHFLQAIPFTALQPAAMEGPVIIVNISEYRSDAIILIKSHPLILVCLPSASPDALQQLAQDLSSALTLDRNNWKHIGPILQMLWDIVVSPVVNQLVALGLRKSHGFGGVRPPIFALCPSMLPVHTNADTRTFPISTPRPIRPLCPH